MQEKPLKVTVIVIQSAATIFEATMYVCITYSKWGYSKDNGEKAEDVKEQHGNIVVSSSQRNVWI